MHQCELHTNTQSTTVWINFQETVLHNQSDFQIILSASLSSWLPQLHLRTCSTSSCEPPPHVDPENITFSAFKKRLSVIFFIEMSGRQSTGLVLSSTIQYI